MKYIWLSALLTISLSACMNQTKETNSQAEIELDSIQVEFPEAEFSVDTNSFFNQIAKFIAGIENSDSNTTSESSKTWRNHSRVLDYGWKGFKQKVAPIVQWRDSVITQGDVVFYPFSGPDFNYLDIFYPEAKTSYLIGLEPVGNIPDFNKMNIEQQTGYFSALVNSIKENIAFSFFRTLSMKADLSGQQVNGVLPLLNVFISLNGYNIINVKDIDIDSSENIFPKRTFTTKEDYTGYIFGKGVEIEYYKPKDKFTRKLYYFCMDLSNYGYKTPLNPSVINNLHNNYITFLKSASYCLPDAKFSKTRELILEGSQIIVQDDSGIPYRYLNENQKWKVDFYGSYSTPIPMFKNYLQAELTTMFPQSKLPFRYGYNKESGIMVCKKNKPTNT